LSGSGSGAGLVLIASKRFDVPLVQDRRAGHTLRVIDPTDGLRWPVCESADPFECPKIRRGGTHSAPILVSAVTYIGS